MIFEDIIFTPIQIEELYKPQMLDGFKDKSLPDFNPVTWCGIKKVDSLFSRIP